MVEGKNEFMIAINESCLKSVIYALAIYILEIGRILYYFPHDELEVADCSFYT